MSRRWHAEHPMPTGSTASDRRSWHRAHARACGCRPVPESLRGDPRGRSRLRPRTGDRPRGAS
ncbi:MAG: hypothetical protein EHM78_13920, partial [Myxococcaceae bacterium]